MNHLRSDRVLVCPHLGDGGSQRVIVTLANAWVNKGMTVTLITLYPKPDSYTLDPRVQRILCAPDKTKNANESHLINWLSCSIYGLLARLRINHQVGKTIYFIRKILALRSAINGTKTPVVIAFIGQTNLLTIIACTGLDKHVVISERNDPARQSLEAPWQGLRRYLYRYATRVTANSRGALKTLNEYVPDKKLAFVPNPIIPTPPDRDFAQIPDSPFILAVGRLHWQKALDVLLMAFAQLPPTLGCSLVLVGRGEEDKSLKDLAQQLGIASRIHWVGHVDNPFIFYRSASLFAQPSRHEGMSNALLEAMSCGLAPVVSDAATGSLELVENEVSGLIVPVEDPAALAHALTRLLQDQKLTRSLGHQAQQRLSPYLLDNALAQWEQVLNGK